MTDSIEQTIGTQLKSRRQEIGISLDEVAAQTRIRRTYLEALETDRFDALPGEAYVNGFLRNYARALGIEAEELLRLRRPQTPEAESKRVAPPTASRPIAAGPPPVSSRPARVVTRRGRRVVLPALLVLLAAAILVPLAFYLAARPGSGAGELPVPAVREDSARVAEPVEPPPPAAAEVPTVVSADVPPVTATVQPAPTIPAAGAVLRLEATGPVQLELTVDSRPPRHYDLKAAAALQWQVGRSARIVVDDPAAAKVWLDDHLLDFSGRTEIVLPPAQVAAQEGSG